MHLLPSSNPDTICSYKYSSRLRGWRYRYREIEEEQIKMSQGERTKGNGAVAFILLRNVYKDGILSYRHRYR